MSRHEPPTALVSLLLPVVLLGLLAEIQDEGDPVVSDLHGTVMVGYQGWFTAAGDGLGAGFVHWGRVDADPPRCTVDMWPDLAEYGDDERFPTSYRHIDGRAAEVFSSFHPETVRRHFRWMREYEIDGAFVQRFATAIRPGDPEHWNDRRTNAVLRNCRAAANEFGRAFAVMYDTDFDAATCAKLKADWTRLRRDMRLLETNAYLHHEGGPLIALWGYGFRHRELDVDAARDLFEFLTAPENGGCRLMLGVPNDWAEWDGPRRAVLDRYASVVSPWNVGRYRSNETADAHFARRWPGDLEACERTGADYLPVVFPGFSWTNLKRGEAPLDQIPRRKGAFYWHQLEKVRAYGMDCAYVAMFDEVDEGTAIFKVTNDPPVGAFVTYEGLPSDHYLELTRQGRRLLRGEPVRLPPPLGEGGR
ncbi:MAG: glycoside hydrolase family 71/99-like protein [Planctomycetota bacterium]